MSKRRTYQWIVDRVKAGEPVAIDSDRPDMNRVIDFLAAVDGRGLAMQIDTKGGLVWVVRAGVNA